MEATITTLPIILPLLLCVAAWATRWHRAASRAVLAVGTFLVVASAGWLFHLADVSEAPVRIDFGNWEKPLGISFQVDLFSSIMVCVAAVIGFAGALFSIGEIGRTTWRKGYGIFFFLLLAGINGAFLTNDLFNLFVWFEIMLMSSFAMLVLGKRKYVFEGATKYVVINMISSFFFLSGIGLVYGQTGQLNMDAVAHAFASAEPSGVNMSAAALILMAFGVKAGLFPLYFWLPPAYPNTGFATAAVFGGLLTKVGVYALFRIFGGYLGFLSEYTGPLFLVVAAFTMVTGVLGAASQFHTRRILSFHIVSQIGYIILGLGLFTQGAIAAAIFYVVHHILVKSNLFLVAGAIAATGRSERLERLGGVLKTSPLLAILFLIPAMSLGGIPPLSGFFAKFLLLREALRSEAYLYAAVAFVVGIITLFSMVKIWGEAYWKDSPRPRGLERTPPVQLVPIAMLATMTVLIGFFVQPLYHISERAAAQLMETNPLHPAHAAAAPLETAPGASADAPGDEAL